MIEEALVALVDMAVGIKPRPTRLEQEPPLPNISYQDVDWPRDYTHDGPSGKAKPRFQLNIWSDSATEAKRLAIEVRQGINGFKGTVLGHRIDGIKVVDQQSTDEPATGRHRVIMDITIDHDEEVA